MLDPIYRAGAEGARCWSRDARGRVSELPMARWIGGSSVSPRDRLADEHILHHCAHHPTLDLGCGPGRFTEMLHRRGSGSLGVDMCRTAVDMTRRRGASAIHADIFEPIPDSGSWDRVLLTDGKIGIGGDPARTLRRAAELLAPSGAIIAEVNAPGSATGRGLLRWETSGHVGSWFEWARVGPESLYGLAAAAGLTVTAVAQIDSRVIVVLRRKTESDHDS